MPEILVPPEVATHLQSLATYLSSQLRLQERTVSSLQSLRYGDASSRFSTATALTEIQMEIVRLAPAVRAMGMPASLTRASAAFANAIDRLGAAVGEVSVGLTDAAIARASRLDRARALAVESEASTRTAAGGLSAALGAAAAAAETIPVVGPIIAAVLAAVAAIIMLIGQILAKAKEDEAAQGTLTTSTGSEPDLRPK
jgi:hypothetical protein